MAEVQSRAMQTRWIYSKHQPAPRVFVIVWAVNRIEEEGGI